MAHEPDIAGLVRPYMSRSECRATVHLGEMVLKARTQGLYPILPPLEETVAEKLLVQGIAVEDVLQVTVADIFASVEAWRAWVKTKIRPGRSIPPWSPTFLKGIIMDKQAAAWEASRATEQREVAAMPKEIKSLADQIGYLPDDQQRDLLWSNHDPIDKRKRIDAIQEEYHCNRNRAMDLARDAWWRERSER